MILPDLLVRAHSARIGSASQAGAARLRFCSRVRKIAEFGREDVTMMAGFARAGAAAVLWSAPGFLMPAPAQEIAASFYAGKTISIIVGF